MSDSSHSPKPWRFKLKNAGNGFLIIDANENHLCDVYMTNLKSIAEDRARVMTAAPELLEALKKMHVALQIGHNDYTDYGANAAIAKAEGK